ncbi:hypothetical protein SALBM135S_07081 [Streptomyces alboniger]
MRAAQRSRVSWESTRGPETACRISVDFPPPGSPETTTRSPSAKVRRCGLCPARCRRSRTTATGSSGPQPSRGGAAACPGSATPVVVA